MKDVFLAFLKFAEKKGLGDACLFVAIVALCFSLLNSMGYHPLAFSHGVMQEASAAVKGDDK